MKGRRSEGKKVEEAVYTFLLSHLLTFSSLRPRASVVTIRAKQSQLGRGFKFEVSRVKCETKSIWRSPAGTQGTDCAKRTQFAGSGRTNEANWTPWPVAPNKAN